MRISDYGRDRAAAALWQAAWRRRRRDRFAATRLGRFVHDGPGPLWAMLIVLAIITAVSLWHIAAALAHGPAEWIARGGYKNALGELCCGERDCSELATADVRVTAAGYHVVSLKETVPFHEAAPSPDGRYWRCAWGGTRKCFFAPPGSM